MKRLDFQTVKRRIRAVPLLLRDKTVPLWKRALVIAAIVYLFLPIDLIPPVIPVLGFLDDVIIWALLLRYLGEDLDSYNIHDPRSNSSEKYRDKNVIDVSYDVNKEEKHD